MYYVVKFTQSNSIGTIRKDWMIDQQKCIFPASKNIRKYLELKKPIKEGVKWNVYDCELKCPKNLGEPGLNSLEEALNKEAFYVDFSDTDDHESKVKLRRYLHKHPLAQFEDNLDLNHLVLQEEEMVFNRY